MVKLMKGEAIAKYLKQSPLSPLTRKHINIKDAIPNYALKSMIEKYLNRGKLLEILYLKKKR